MFNLFINLFTKPDKAIYLMYFFPIISQGYVLYDQFNIYNMIIFIFSVIVVTIMESYHLALEMFSSKEESIKVKEDLKSIGKRNINKTDFF